MRITRFGLQAIVFYVTMLGAFFAAPYSNLFFLLLGFLTLLGLFGLLAARRNLRGVEAVLPELPPQPTDAGSPLPVAVEAPGAARLQVAARVELAGGRELFGQVEWVRGRATLLLGAPALPRGCYAVERALLESSHPFGLVRMRRPFEAPGELIVYPAPREQLDGRSGVEALDELLGRADPGAGNLQPASLRDHREGDGMRGIHWRASARRARLVMQEWEGGTGQGLEVALDRRCTPDALDEALATISALVSLARTNKETLRVHSQGLSATYGDGHQPWREALRFLASAEALPAGSPPPPSTSPAVVRLPRAPEQVAAHAG